MLDTIEHGDDVEKRKDRMTLAAIYQAVSKDTLLKLAKKVPQQKCYPLEYYSTFIKSTTKVLKVLPLRALLNNQNL